MGTIDVEEVLGALTLEQKVSLLSGADAWHTVELPGVPPLRCSDGPAGVRGTSWQGPSSASFPCGTALGATFDPGLVEEVGQALGREALSKGVNVLLAPTVNLHRTPIGGRNFECMSEDPFLTARIAVGYVRGVQSERVAACIKHFIANDTEFERMTISSEVDERTLRELYLVPFEAAVEHADVRAVMSSYNRINGTYACDNEPLLRGVLRDDFGFDGVVFSDWFGTHSAAASLEAGLDLEMPGPPLERGEKLVAAVRAGEVSEARVDESVRRLLELFAWSQVGERDTTETAGDSPETRELIRRAAVAATVLLKNDGDVLPLAASARLALIGPNAERGEIQGGGSAQVRPSHPSRLLGALRDRGLDVTYEQGCSIDKLLPALRGQFTARYESGTATAEQPLGRLGMVWMEAPAPGLDRREFTVTITGTFTPDRSGDWTFGVSAVGPIRLTVDGTTLVDLPDGIKGGGFFGNANPEERVVVPLRAGVPSSIEIVHGQPDTFHLRAFSVGAVGPADTSGIDRAVAAAAAADVAVVVVGTNSDWETEAEDRATMDLPGEQDELVRRVAAANPRTVVVVNAGSPVTMPWIADVAAVAQIWFPGEALGDAVADVLLGDAEPGGRLPVTIPKRLADMPAAAYYPGSDGRAVYGERRLIGYRWYDARDVEPQFPFGHGLGYTTLELGAATVEASSGDEVRVTVPVNNTGARAGSTVVQCYVAAPRSGDDDQPLRTLAGFAKVALAPGASTTVELPLGRRAFATWDVDAHAWVVPAGDHEISVGTSSRSLASAGTVTLSG